MSPRRGSIGLLVTLQRCRADGAGQCVVEHADVGDGLPERGGVVHGQFRAVVIAVTLGGLKMDRDCGIGMGGAEAVQVAGRDATSELVERVEFNLMLSKV